MEGEQEQEQEQQQELEQQVQQQQEKRRRRPSVRLGEIGFADASSLWIEAPRQRRKAAAVDVLSTGKPRSRSPGAKAPRIRPLEQLGQEEWAVIEPLSSPAKAKRVYRKLRGKNRYPAAVEPAEEKETIPLQADDEAPILSTSSGSEELLLKEEDEEEENAPADDSGNDVVKPNSHGDEIQGAIEDGPKVFSRGKQRLGERRSGRQAAIRAIRDIAAPIAGERPAAVTATIVTPNSSQRGALSGGVSGWLHDLGLEKYLELFELNEVDTEVLPHLTFEDLREMGVDAVGARRKMFNAIQDLGQIRGI